MIGDEVHGQGSGGHAGLSGIVHIEISKVFCILLTGGKVVPEVHLAPCIVGVESVLLQARILGLGQEEESVGMRLTEVVTAISREEERTRAELITRQRLLFLNACGRAYGLLRNTYLIPTSEALDALSIMKLGADSGVFRHFSRQDWAELLLECQPAHLCCKKNMNLSPVERGEYRATCFRERLHGPAPAPGSPDAADS